MKFIIDLIEDVREQIGNGQGYTVMAGLLREDKTECTKLVYSGEAYLNTYILEEEQNQLRFNIDNSDTRVMIEELIPSLLILGVDSMMYTLKIDVNENYKDMKIVGFGKNIEEKRYILFIKI
jgi:hypothetical protein